MVRKIVRAEDIRCVGLRCDKCNAEIYLEVATFQHGFPDMCNICGAHWRSDDQAQFAIQLLRAIQENLTVRTMLVFEEKDIPSPKGGPDA